jgi:hyperosmotically inducible protein
VKLTSHRRYIGAAVLAAVVGLAGTFGQASVAAAQVTAVKDGWITMKVHSLYTPEDALEGSNIDVDTKAGVVTLSGTVPNAAARTKAVAIAKATNGVKSVRDTLTIGSAEKAIDTTKTREAGRTTGRYVTDGYAKSAIYTKFIPENSLEDSDIDVDIKNGVVTLNGTVKTAAGKAKAAEIAKGTAGVKRVNNALVVK